MQYSTWNKFDKDFYQHVLYVCQKFETSNKIFKFSIYFISEAENVGTSINDCISFVINLFTQVHIRFLTYMHTLQVKYINRAFQLVKQRKLENKLTVIPNTSFSESFSFDDKLFIL